MGEKLEKEKVEEVKPKTTRKRTTTSTTKSTTTRKKVESVVEEKPKRTTTKKTSTTKKKVEDSTKEPVAKKTTTTRKSTKVEEKVEKPVKVAKKTTAAKASTTKTATKKSTTSVARKSATTSAAKKTATTSVLRKSATTAKTPVKRKTATTSKVEDSEEIKTETKKAPVKRAIQTKTQSKATVRKVSKNPEELASKTVVQRRNKRIAEVINIVEEDEREKAIHKKKEEIVDLETELKAIEEERKRKKLIPEKAKGVILSGAFGNIFAACFVTFVLIVMNLSFKFASDIILENVLKATTFGSLLITLILFERAYKKDNDTLAIFGIEMMIFSIFNLASVYLAIMQPKNFTILMSATAVIFEVYYIIKASLAFQYRKKKYYKDTNEIKKLIRKNINVDIED